VRPSFVTNGRTRIYRDGTVFDDEDEARAHLRKIVEAHDG
jgi:hypothetical protein